MNLQACIHDVNGAARSHRVACVLPEHAVTATGPVVAEAGSHRVA